VIVITIITSMTTGFGGVVGSNRDTGSPVKSVFWRHIVWCTVAWESNIGIAECNGFVSGTEHMVSTQTALCSCNKCKHLYQFNHTTIGQRVHYKTATIEFSVAGPTAWNSLPNSGTRCQTISVIRCSESLHCIRAHSTLEALHNVLYKCSTYLLTDITYRM